MLSSLDDLVDEKERESAKEKVSKRYDQQIKELILDTKNPKLYAEVIREGAPGDPLVLQVSNGIIWDNISDSITRVDINVC